LVPDRRSLNKPIDGFFIFDQRAAEGEIRRVAQDRLRLLEQAEEASRLKDRLLANVSHQLRTPLTSIVGWATLINSREVEPEQLHLATTTIERNARVQAQLIEDLLDVSRIVAGKLILSVRQVDMSRLVRETIETWKPKLQEKGIKIDVELSRKLDPIEGDPERIQQILNNLISNSVCLPKTQSANKV
jgi:signal transduction histidine kinase